VRELETGDPKETTRPIDAAVERLFRRQITMNPQHPSNDIILRTHARSSEAQSRRE